ncbi:MAG TPA: polysaccharide deacetylase family protein [Patescibacteria group bacterium]
MTKVIYLTFDDGPNEPYTSQILDLLAEYNAKATFFVIGKNVEKYPEVTKRIVLAGHAIGIHSYTHNPVKVILGQLMEEIALTEALIKKYTGVETKLYRSPWGITMPWLGTKLRAAGYALFHWDIMAHDWWQPSVEFISSHIVQRAFPGAVILLHDGDQLNSGSRKNTIESLRIILKELISSGYSFEVLPKELAKSPKSLIVDNWKGIMYLVRNLKISGNKHGK